jgi:hypothetical protein
MMELANLCEKSKKSTLCEDLSFLEDLEAREQRYRSGKKSTTGIVGASEGSAQSVSKSSSSSSTSGWKKGFFSGQKLKTPVLEPQASQTLRKAAPVSAVPLNIEIVRPESEPGLTEVKTSQLISECSAFTAQVIERQHSANDNCVIISPIAVTSASSEEKIEIPQKTLSIFAQQRLKMKTSSKTG